MAKVSDAHLAARRRSILDAATQIFSEKGIEQTTMAEVAAAAGISPGAIYRYFENKEDLAHGCMSANADEIEGQWQYVDEATPNPLGAFQELASLTFGLLNRPEARVDSLLALEQFLVMARSQQGASGMDHDFTTVVDGIAGRLKHAQDRGQLPEELNVSALAGALFSFYWGARLIKMLEPETDTDAQLESLNELLGNSMRPRG